MTHLSARVPVAQLCTELVSRLPSACSLSPAAVVPVEGKQHTAAGCHFRSFHFLPPPQASSRERDSEWKAWGKGGTKQIPLVIRVFPPRYSLPHHNRKGLGKRVSEGSAFRTRVCYRQEENQLDINPTPGRDRVVLICLQSFFRDLSGSRCGRLNAESHSPTGICFCSYSRNRSQFAPCLLTHFLSLSCS